MLPDGTSIAGEKALYRILTWKQGRFEFVPGEPSEGGRIRKSTRVLLLEGMRLLEKGLKLLWLSMYQKWTTFVSVSPCQ